MDRENVGGNELGASAQPSGLWNVKADTHVYQRHVQMARRPPAKISIVLNHEQAHVIDKLS